MAMGGPGWSDAAIAGALDVNASTVLRALYSAVIQGPATVVAVVGGFLLIYGLGRGVPAAATFPSNT